MILLLTLLHATVHVIASQGDRSPLFNSCLYSCFHDHRCSGKETLLPRPTFSCEQQCKYDCMWLQEREFRSHTPPLHVQYYGKWPFIKLGPVQEPLSTLFSILNGYFHVLALRSTVSSGNPHHFPKVWRYFNVLNSVLAINAWVWSSVFHVQDNWLTERLDYHSAVAHMVMQLWFALARLGFTQRFGIAFISLSGAALWLWFASHVYYLNVVHFDYGYNMRATIAVVVLQVLAWVAWSVKNAKQQWETSRMTVLFQLGVVACALFEVFDFPPVLDALDAHAMWHFSTIFLVRYWYAIRARDELEWKQQSKLKSTV
jgi:hypothetical protein